MGSTQRWVYVIIIIGGKKSFPRDKWDAALVNGSLRGKDFYVG